MIIVIGWYLMACTAKGMTKLGMRFFFMNFYPMKPKETFVNALFANNLCLNLYTFAIVHLMVELFRGYMRNTEIALMFQVNIKHVWMFRWFWERNFFIVWMIVWYFISLIYFILKPYEKIEVGNQLKRADLGAKH